MKKDIKSDEVKQKAQEIANNFAKRAELIALSPKFERALLNSPFPGYGLLKEIKALEDRDSPLSTFVKKFLEENRVKF